MGQSQKKMRGRTFMAVNTGEAWLLQSHQDINLPEGHGQLSVLPRRDTACAGQMVEVQGKGQVKKSTEKKIHWKHGGDLWTLYKRATKIKFLKEPFRGTGAGSSEIGSVVLRPRAVDPVPRPSPLKLDWQYTVGGASEVLEQCQKGKLGSFWLKYKFLVLKDHQAKAEWSAEMTRVLEKKMPELYPCRDPYPLPWRTAPHKQQKSTGVEKVRSKDRVDGTRGSEMWQEQTQTQVWGSIGCNPDLPALAVESHTCGDAYRDLSVGSDVRLVVLECGPGPVSWALSPVRTRWLVGSVPGEGLPTSEWVPSHCGHYNRGRLST